MNNPQGRLSFATLDELAFAADRGRLPDGENPLPEFLVEELGPFLELQQLLSSGLFESVSADSLIVVDNVSKFYAELKSGRPSWVCPTGKSGFFRTVDQPDYAWPRFQLRIQKAAESAGFSHSTAQQFIAAIGELEDNIRTHSEKVLSGLIAFKASDGLFEFVISDSGIGVLESLRSCADYQNVKDHGDALKLCLRDGVSRFGKNTNHGWGFRPLFVGLASLWGFLRFRSGNHALVVNGKSPSLPSAQLSEKPPLRGFIASVSCRRYAAAA